MKIKTDKQTSFTPCSITFTFESQAELDAMFSLFNYTAVADLHGTFGDVWRDLRGLYNPADMARVSAFDARAKILALDARAKILRNYCNRQEIIDLAKEYTTP